MNSLKFMKGSSKKEDIKKDFELAKKEIEIMCVKNGACKKN